MYTKEIENGDNQVMGQTEPQLNISHQQMKLPGLGRGYIQLSYCQRGPIETPKQPKIVIHNRTDAHKNSWRLWEYSQGLCRFKQMGVSALRVGSLHGRPPLTKKLLWYSLAQKNLFSPMESQWVYNPHFRAGPIPSWPIHNKSNGISVYFHLILPW